MVCSCTLVSNEIRYVVGSLSGLVASGKLPTPKWNEYTYIPTYRLVTFFDAAASFFYAPFNLLLQLAPYGCEFEEVVCQVLVIYIWHVHMYLFIYIYMYIFVFVLHFVGLARIRSFVHLFIHLFIYYHYSLLLLLFALWQRLACSITFNVCSFNLYVVYFIYLCKSIKFTDLL